MFGIAIHDERATTSSAPTRRSLGVDVPAADGDGEMTFDFERVPLLDGTYLVTLAIQSTDEGTVLRLARAAVPVRGDEPGRTAGMVSLRCTCGSARRIAAARRRERLVVARHFRARAVRKLDDVLSPHYVRQEEVDRALRELDPRARRPVRRRGRGDRGVGAAADGAHRARWSSCRKSSPSCAHARDRATRSRRRSGPSSSTFRRRRARATATAGSRGTPSSSPRALAATTRSRARLPAQSRSRPARRGRVARGNRPARLQRPRRLGRRAAAAPRLADRARCVAQPASGRRARPRTACTSR